MRKLLKGLLVLTVMTTLGMSISISANDDIRVTVSGQEIHFENQGPVIVDGRTLVPVREVFEAMRFSVDWHEETQTVLLVDNAGIFNVKIRINEPYFSVNLFTPEPSPEHEVIIALDVPAQIIGGRTMLPLRSVLEAVGYQLIWDEATATVSIIATVLERESVFDKIEPYTVGSNQEWALWALSQLDNSAEKIRLYNFLLRAHTYLMLYDERDLTTEHRTVKNQWLNFLEEIPSEQVREMLDDENWTIDIWYPLEKPFRLSQEEFLQTYWYFSDANPQFFMNRIIPVTMSCDIGLTPGLSISAYWAFAERRQETYNNIQNTFDVFRLRMERSIDTNNRYHAARYVYRQVIEMLNYNQSPGLYLRKNLDMEHTILGFFSDRRLTTGRGYAITMTYLLNRLGIPAITAQGGAMNVHDSNSGLITRAYFDVWNVVNINNTWYFLDASREAPGEYHRFLKRIWERDISHILRCHSRSNEMVYIDVTTSEFSHR